MWTAERYQKQTQLPGFGTEGQKKLAEARVLVVGAGGLGVPVLQYLTGMGLGYLGIVDGDTVSESNLHRQLIYTPEDLGRQKTDCCISRLRQQNPGISIQGFPYFLTSQNALRLIGQFDLVVDATDNFDTRYLINDACVMLKKPFVYGALQYFEGHVSVFNYQNGPTYRCLYPKPPTPDQIPDCNAAGVLGIVPGLVGCHQALEVVKLITGIGQSLSGKLQVFDFLNNSQYTVQLRVREENKHIDRLPESIPVSCDTAPSISARELSLWIQQERAFSLVDVREAQEFRGGHVKNALSFPLSQINGKLPELPRNRPWVLLCQQGGRSRQALQRFLQLDPDLQLVNLEGGMTGLLKHLGEQEIVRL